MSCIFVDEDKYEIFVYDEIYRTQLTNQQIRDNIRYKGYMNDVIIADNEDARTINELRLLGLNRIKAAQKGKGSVLAGIQKLQDYHIYVHPRCMNHVVEFSNYVWDKDKDTGKPINEPMDEYNHLMDALRYATERCNRRTFSF